MNAGLYLDRVDFCRYWPETATVPYGDFLTQIKSREIRMDDYPFLSWQQKRAFELVLEAERYLPQVPLMTVPQPIEPELIPQNTPDENSLVIVSGNNKFTVDVLATVWSWGITPAYFMLVDCLGNTVDMSMVYGDFSPERLQEALEKSGLEHKVRHRHMIVPGLTQPLARDFVSATNWEIEVGPICATELPLFLGDRWRLA